ncbi:MAG TPA: hypothetical protein ENJ46_04190 [Hellea balneolensis]|uniref:Uncharacterized protein n=1 Tax=Hellea balneolensis TaxID=287478 RepID=A0A7C3C4F5_9PROT|nr:hypothetical protein [Hellea balneolensis]
MPLLIRVSKIFSGVIDNIITVAFSADEFGECEYIIFQEQETFDSQDLDLGMDKVHVELCEQINSQYGGIVEFRADKKSLHVFFEAQTQLFKCVGDSGVKLHIDTQSSESKTALSILKRIAIRNKIPNNL